MADDSDFGASAPRGIVRASDADAALRTSDDGDFWIEDRGSFDFSSQRKLFGPLSIVRLGGNGTGHFRRGAGHVVQSGVELAVLWFVKRGELAYADARGEAVIWPGEAIVTRSHAPFTMTCRPRFGQPLDVAHVALAVGEIETRTQRPLASGLRMPCVSGELRAAETLLTDLFDADGTLLDATPPALANCALALIGAACRAAETATAAPSQTKAESRLRQIYRFIDIHLANPGLSAAMLAEGCGISPRYLSTLLHSRGASFSQIVWERRLRKARSWLAEVDPQDVSVSEVAFALGFKSAAHFSRKFKKAFGMSPSGARGATVN